MRRDGQPAGSKEGTKPGVEWGEAARVGVSLRVAETSLTRGPGWHGRREAHGGRAGGHWPHGFETPGRDYGPGVASRGRCGWGGDGWSLNGPGPDRWPTR